MTNTTLSRGAWGGVLFLVYNENMLVPYNKNMLVIVYQCGPCFTGSLLSDKWHMGKCIQQIIFNIKNVAYVDRSVILHMTMGVLQKITETIRSGNFESSSLGKNRVPVIKFSDAENMKLIEG